MLILTLRHVAKAFGTDTVLRDVSLALNQGERLGLVGVNGSGKTTLLRILAGEMPPDEGDVSMQRGLRVAYLSQVFTPGPGHT
ncbi:MAG TPA: ATP-binding cassette domain-containing protein, partial [Candidatus Limnocylindria bacterium]|nr:ATP-binding cassette domain-containing protein [Candidatus Limnocylindria bacterium]